LTIGMEWNRRSGVNGMFGKCFRYEGEWLFRRYDKGWLVAEEPTMRQATATECGPVNIDARSIKILGEWNEKGGGNCLTIAEGATDSYRVAFRYCEAIEDTGSLTVTWNHATNSWESPGMTIIPYGTTEIGVVQNVDKLLTRSKQKFTATKGLVMPFEFIR